MTLALGSWPRKKHGKVWAENVSGEITHSQMDFHFGYWNFYGVPNFHKVIWRVKIYWIADFFIPLKKLLRLKCLKWVHMIHLSTYNTSYGWKKSQESKCQFDSPPLKVENCLELHVFKWHATYR